MLLPVMVNGQNFEDDFNAFVHQNEQSFNRFSDSINRVFAEAMEANMKAFFGEKPKVRDAKPKPVNAPVAPQLEPQPDPMPEVDPLRPNPLEKPEPERPALPDIVLSEPENPSPSTLAVDHFNMLGFNLFGENVQIIKEPFPDRLSGIAPKNVSDFWLQLSGYDYKEMMQACHEMQEISAFNDWATYQLVLEFARRTYTNLYNEQAVMSVFLLNQLGKEAKVGFDDTHLFCLLAVDQQLYGVSYADISNHRYYIFDTDPNYSSIKPRPFRTYDIPFPKKTKKLDMNIRHPLKTVSNSMPNNVIQFNKNMIDLFKTYPQVDIEVYANAQPSEEFCASVNHVIKPHIENLTPYKAVSYLLNYVQYNFKYATDDNQFGYEKPFFCEENFYYPQNDCEDRSVLFSFLIRYLLHMDVVLIDYPGHIATAVHFDEDVPGSSVIHNGKRYVICDPTYIGASVGVEMSGFTAADRTVVPLAKR